MVRDVASLGYTPSFCTACYRLGRTGADFMDLAKPGLIKQHCGPNALSSCMEYLLDYASPQTREVGEQLVDTELNTLEAPRAARSRTRLVDGGARRTNGTCLSDAAMNAFRTERDLLGELQIPAAALHGVHTARALENFPLSGRPVHPELARAYGTVKLACARTNRALGCWNGDPEKADAIERACRELSEGSLAPHIVVDSCRAARAPAPT